MDKISILIPTRNRPQNIRRLVESAYNLADEPDLLQIWFYVDNDDVLSVPAIYDLWDICPIEYMQGPRIILSNMTNELYSKCDGDIIGHMGDDVEFKSPSWDSTIRQEINKFADKICLIYGKDGYNEVTSTWFFFHRHCVDLMGHVCPPNFKGDYADSWNTEVFKMIDRFIISDVYIHHHHPVVTKLPPDRTNNEKNAACYSGPMPCHVQFEIERPKRQQLAAKLRQHLKTVN